VAFRLDVDIAFIAVLQLRGAVQNAEVEGGEQFNLRKIGAGMAAGLSAFSTMIRRRIERARDSSSAMESENGFITYLLNL